MAIRIGRPQDSQRSSETNRTDAGAELMKPQRIGCIDTAKGICIALVVAFHCNLHYDETTDHLLGCIRLPLYYFLLGLFFKQYDGYYSFIKKKVNKLLIPFFFFYFFTSVLLPAVAHYIFGYQINTVVGWRSLYAFITPEEFPNIPIWFLWSLFLINIIFYFVVLIVGQQHRWVVGIVAVLLGIGGFALSYFDYDWIAFIDNTLYYLPFFFFGYSFKRFVNRLRTQICWILLVVCLPISYILSNIQTTQFLSSMLLFYVAGCFGVVFIIVLSSRLGEVFYLTYIGRYSIMLLVTHCLILQLFEMAIAWIGLKSLTSNILTFLLTISSYAVIIPLMQRYLPYVTAQKDLI